MNWIKLTGRGGSEFLVDMTPITDIWPNKDDGGCILYTGDDAKHRVQEDLDTILTRIREAK